MIAGNRRRNPFVFRQAPSSGENLSRKQSSFCQDLKRHARRGWTSRSLRGELNVSTPSRQPTACLGLLIPSISPPSRKPHQATLDVVFHEYRCTTQNQRDLRRGLLQ